MMSSSKKPGRGTPPPGSHPGGAAKFTTSPEIFWSATFPGVHVTADPSNLGSDIQRRRLAALLAYQLGGDDGEYYRRLRPTRFRYNRKGEPLLGEDGKPVEVPNRYTVIARDLDIDVADAIKKQLQVTRINGVLFFTDSYKRTYPKGVDALECTRIHQRGRRQ